MSRRRLTQVGVAAVVVGALALALPSVLPRVLGGDGGRSTEDGTPAPPPQDLPPPTARTSVLFVPRAGADVAALARRHGLDPATLGPPGAAGQYRAEVPYEQADGLVAALRADPDVAAAQGPRAVVPFEVPDDDGYKDPFFGERKQWGLRRINPESAWDDEAVRKDASDLLIVVADTGVDGDHADLRLGEAGPVSMNEPRKPSYPADPEKAWHGTAVAGAAAGLSDNGDGIASPAWEQSVASWNAIGTNNAAGGYAWALEQAKVGDPAVAPYDTPRTGAKRVVYNGSYGDCDGKGSCAEEGFSIEAGLLRAGMESGRVLWVFSAGNYDLDRAAFPARYPYAVAVAATEPSDDMWGSSNHGTGVDVAAPGVSIYTTMPDDKYGSAKGTSFSAPLVSGVAAAIWKREPLLTSQQVMKRLLASTGQSRSDDLGYGIVDMDHAFTLDQQVPTVTLARRAAAPGAALSVDLRVVDDLDARGLEPIDETVDLEEDKTDSWRLDFSQVPTSAIDTVKWSIDGGAWHEVPIDRTDVQHHKVQGPGPCQICTQIDVPAEELALVAEHRLVVRAWDSSPKAEAKYGEAQFTFMTDDVPDRGEGSSTALLVDRSGSMSERFQQTTKLDAAKQAAGSFLDLVGQAQQVGGRHATAVVAFADGATVRPALTSDVAALKAAVQALTSGGGTDIGSAIRDGLAEVERGVGARTMVLLSDGLPTSGMNTDQILSGPVADAQRRGIPINTIAVGETAQSNRPFLEEIARRTKGVASVASTPNELVFRYLAAEHRSSGVVLYEGRAPAAELRVPRLAASLRISVFSASGPLPAVSVVSPSGTRYPIEPLAAAGVTSTSTTVRPSTTVTTAPAGSPAAAGAGGVAQLNLPNPLAGAWRVQAGQPVDLVVSAQPATEEKTRAATAIPDDPAPPRIQGLAAVRARPVPEPVTALVVRGAGAGLMGIGFLLLALGLYLPATRRPPPPRPAPERVSEGIPPAEVQVLDPPSQRVRTCRCGRELQPGSRFCGGCGQPVEQGLRLDVRAGPDRGRSFLARPGDVIGRGAEATVRLADAAVSRSHARLEPGGESWRLVDLGSTGGTAVNGTAAAEHGLRDGDEITVGLTVLVVRGTEP